MITLEDIKLVANEVKTVPLDWIVKGRDVNENFINYCKPLIKGELDIKYENGVIKYFKF